MSTLVSDGTDSFDYVDGAAEVDGNYSVIYGKEIGITRPGVTPQEFVAEAEKAGAVCLPAPEGTPPGWRPKKSVDLTATILATDRSNQWRNNNVSNFFIACVPYAIPRDNKGIIQEIDLAHALNKISDSQVEFGETVCFRSAPESYGLIVQGTTQNIADNDGSNLRKAGGLLATVTKGLNGFRTSVEVNKLDKSQDRFYLKNESGYAINSGLIQLDGTNVPKYRAMAIASGTSTLQGCLGATDLADGEDCCFRIPQEVCTVGLFRLARGPLGRKQRNEQYITDIENNNWVQVCAVQAIVGQSIVFLLGPGSRVVAKLVDQSKTIFFEPDMKAIRGQNNSVIE